jgi:mxaA protein
MLLATPRHAHANSAATPTADAAHPNASLVTPTDTAHPNASLVAPTDAAHHDAVLVAAAEAAHPNAAPNASGEPTPGAAATTPPANPNVGPLPPGAAGPSGSATEPTAAPQVEGDEATVEQPRPFGYVLGDTLTQRVFLAPEFQPEALPPLERAGLWFARRSATLKKGDDGRQWLIMDYQLVNAPQALMTVNLPAVTLKSKAGKVLTVSMWPISVAPLTPQHAFAKGGLQELRPDHPAPKVPTSALQRQLQVWLTAFAVTVAAWLAWWVIRSIRAAANQPFARALREVRQAGDDSPDAWLALHRAFDRTAGRALQSSTLPTLFKQAPHLAAERTAIEQFYAQSNLRFFGGGTSRAQTSPTPAAPAQAPASVSASASASAGSGGAVDLRALAATLRRLEKQHER